MTRVKVIETYNKLLIKKTTFLIICLIFISIFISQVFNFLNNKPINGIVITDPNAWIVWTTLTLSTMGSMIAFYSTILTINLNPNFFKFQIVSFILFITSTSLVFVWYSSLRLLIGFYFSFIRFLRWNGQKKKEVQVETLKFKSLLFHIAFAIALVVGFAYAMIGINAVVDLQNPFPWLDSANVVFAIYGAYLMAKTFKQSWLFYLFADIITVILFSLVGLWSYAFRGFLFVIIDIFSYLSWDQKRKDQLVKQNS